MPDTNEEALLLEYSRCDEKVGRIDGLVWQMATVLFPIMLAGFAYFGLMSVHTVSQFFIILVVAIGSLALIVTWYLLARQWHGYQKIAYYRLREIEEELGLWHYRYSGFMSKSPKSRKVMLTASENTERQARLRGVEAYIGSFPRPGLHGAVTAIAALFGLGWVALVIREAFLVFLP